MPFNAWGSNLLQTHTCGDLNQPTFLNGSPATIKPWVPHPPTTLAIITLKPYGLIRMTDCSQSSRLSAYHYWLRSWFKCTHMIRHWDLSKWLCVTVRINKNYRGGNSSRRYRLGLQKGRVKVGEAVKHHTNQKLCLQIMLLCRHVQWYITYRWTSLINQVQQYKHC